MNPELVAQGFECATVGAQAADSTHLFFGELRDSDPLAARNLSPVPASALDHVSGVISVGSYVEMGRIYARRVVALVQDMEPRGYWTDEVLICEAVRGHGMTGTVPNPPVTEPVPRARPLPALCIRTFLNLRPKPLNGWGHSATYRSRHINRFDVRYVIPVTVGVCDDACCSDPWEKRAL